MVPTFNINGNYLASSSDTTFIIRINVIMDGGAVLYRHGVVTRTDNPAQPYTIVFWQSGYKLGQQENKHAEDEEGNG